MFEIKRVPHRVRLDIGRKGEDKVLRLYASKQYIEAYNWFQPNDAKGILAYVAKITGKGGKYEGMKFDSIFTDEIEKHKGEVYVGYHQRYKDTIQIRRASTGSAEERQATGAEEINII